MSMVADVVFCVDCDLARSAQLNAAVGATAGPAEERPRRMATKKDASGDALCAACLDARLMRRRTAFVLHKVQSASVESPASTPKVVNESARKFSSVRIVRTRTEEDAVQARPPVAAAPKKARVTRVTRVPRIPKAPEKVRVVAEVPDKADLIAQVLAEALRVTDHVPNSDDRKLQSRFVQIAADIGLVRARELLDEVRAACHRRTRGLSKRPV